MIWSQAESLARRISLSLKPYVSKGMIAGSIRRKKSEVKDIELVLAPIWKEEETEGNLFGPGKAMVNVLYERWGCSEAALHRTYADCPRIEWIKPGVPGIVPWDLKPEGKYWRGYLPDEDVKLDIFLATPSNFGVISLIRTGSREFSEAVVTYALKVGYKFEGGQLKQGGRVVSTPDEADVFRHLGLACIPAKDREGPFSLMRASS